MVALSLVRYFRVINKVSEKPAAWFLAMIHHTGGHTPSILDAMLWELAIGYSKCIGYPASLYRQNPPSTS